MKTLRRFCAATILSLTLTISAFAGHIDCPGVASTGTGTGTTSVTTTAVITVVSLTY